MYPSILFHINKILYLKYPVLDSPCLIEIKSNFTKYMDNWVMYCLYIELIKRFDFNQTEVYTLFKVIKQEKTQSKSTVTFQENIQPSLIKMYSCNQCNHAP